LTNKLKYKLKTQRHILKYSLQSQDSHKAYNNLCLA